MLPGKPGRKTKTIAAAVTGAALLLLVAGASPSWPTRVSITGRNCTVSPPPTARSAPAQAPRQEARAVPGTRPPRRRWLGGARPPPRTARPRAKKHADRHPAPSAAGSSSASPSPEVTPTGRAAFGGTWDGTGGPPGWSVASSSTIQLTIPASAPQGSYDSPSTACTGSVSVQSSSGSSLSAVAPATSLINPDCALLAHVTLTLTGPDQLSMTWEPAGLEDELGTAALTRS